MKYISLLTLLFITPVMGFSAPKSVYEPYWDKSDETSTASIDYAVFNRFLTKYAKVQDGITKIPYADVTPVDKQMLTDFVNNLASIPIFSYSKAVQQAYWINLYNALTIKVILDTYPVNSIKESYGGILRSGPWERKLLTIEGRELGLNDIEHRILRPIWKDARVHFLVNCASIGCPNLPLQAITPDTYESRADSAAALYINNPRGVKMEGNRLIFTSLVDWYKEDFGTSIDNIVNFYLKFANEATRSMLMDYKNKRISYDYDWDLNITK